MTGSKKEVKDTFILLGVQTGLYISKENKYEIIGFQCVYLYMMIMTTERTMYTVFECEINLISTYFIELLCKQLINSKLMSKCIVICNTSSPVHMIFFFNFLISV